MLRMTLPSERVRARRPLLSSTLVLPLLLLAAGASTGLRLLSPAVWASLDTSRRNVYCEDVRWDAVLRQPVNTLSNLPFALGALHQLLLGSGDLQAWRSRGPAAAAVERGTELARFPFYTLCSAAAQLWVAVGSAFFHGSWSRAGQRADIGAVYAVLLCPVLYVAQRLGLLGPGDAQSPFLAALVASTTALTAYKWRIKSSIVVPALIGALVGLLTLWFRAGSPALAQPGGLQRWLLGPVQRERPRELAHPVLVAAALAIGLAFAATAYDMSLIACSPRSNFQWHAVWHLFAAVSLQLLNRFLRSEAPR